MSDTGRRPEVPDYRQQLTLEGRGFIVLGAGDGIGRQCCHALAQAGAKLLCVDRDEQLAARVASEVRGVPASGDVIRRADVERLVSMASEQFGSSFHGIVDIVGMAMTRPLASFDDAAWDSQFDVVLRHAYLALQIGGGALAANGRGTLVFVGSMSGSVSVASQAAYGSAKAALHHLVRCAAHELGAQNVRVNAVAPSFVCTPRLLQVIPKETWDRIAERNPLKRVATPAEIASAILFLASDLASYVTGHVLAVDGGMSLVAALPEFSLVR